MKSSNISFLLALEAWWALLRAAIVIRIPFGRQMILRRAMNTGAMTGGVPCTSATIKEAVRQSARFHLKVMTCLEQSLATVWMHWRRGLPAWLQVGCRREGSQLFFHAWVAGPKLVELKDKENSFGALAPVSYQSIVPA
jgi:Transglutaminase-like superfamily